MTRTLARLVVASLAGIACVQTGSVGSDTGRAADGIDPSADDGTDAATEDGITDGDTDDRYEICEDVDTTGDPFPDSCTPSPSDSPCLQCIKLICCSELVSCPSYEACACQIDCAEANGTPDVCNEACGGTDQGCDLSGCGALECEQLCVG